MDHSPPFNGEDGPFDPYDNQDFSNFDINFGPFASGSQDASLTHGLDSLGNCNNNENACLDQRCFDHYNGATNSEIELDGAVNNLNLDANLMSQVDPMAALQSIHQAQQAHQAQVQAHAQMMLRSPFALQDNAQMQWANNQLMGWGVDNSATAGPAFHAPGQNQGAGSIACNSNCGGCMSQCGETADVDCCYNASCAGIDVGHSVHSDCCFDESCSIGEEPCISENCHGPAHPCYDSSCMVPSQTVSATPESASVPTPRTFDFDPMIMAPSDNMNSINTDPLVEEPALAQPKPNGSIMEKHDQYKCFWICPEGYMCPEKFLNSDDLHTHCKKAHLATLKKEQGGFICQWSPCTRKDGKAFTQKSKLERHLQTHTGYKPVRCEVCGLALSAKQSLEQHMRTHTGETPWACPFPGCGQSFKQQSAHTMHVRTHTGEKPLQCEICGKRFSESSNLSKHRKTHDEVGGEFSCGECGRAFRRADQLRRHISMRH